jgi:hypothetical protein
MEVETMLEDDVFFAELSKRISLLITDDDEGGADFAAAAQFVPAAAPLPVSLRSHPSSSPSIKHVHARVLVRPRRSHTFCCLRSRSFSAGSWLLQPGNQLKSNPSTWLQLHTRQPHQTARPFVPLTQS